MILFVNLEKIISLESPGMRNEILVLLCILSLICYLTSLGISIPDVYSEHLCVHAVQVVRYFDCRCALR